MEIASIRERLSQIGIGDNVLKHYQHPHRHYHNLNHISQVLNHLEMNGGLDDLLFLAAVYHDAVYAIHAKDNEAQSARMFEIDAQKVLSTQAIDTVKGIIMATANHTAHDTYTQRMIDADLEVFNRPIAELIEFEKAIYKEYQSIPYQTYKTQRVKVLERFNVQGKLNALIDYVNTREPLTGVFCGSFNPFHKGHYNILQKAERIFDKVIIAFGKNPDKTIRSWPIPQLITNRQIENYEGLLTDFIATLQQEVVVIRGLRNSTDFQYEQNQYRYIQELMPEIKIVNIFCDKEFEHISSSGIRTLEKYDRHHSYLLE